MRVLSAILLSTALMVPGLAPTLALADDHIAPATITVTGEGVVTAAPDLATVSLGVTTQGETAAAAMAANTEALTAVLERVKAAGIEDRDIQTSTLNLNPNWSNSDGSSMPVIQGYVASNILSIRVRDMAKLGGVLDAAITDGANTLNGINFGLAEPDPAMGSGRRLCKSLVEIGDDVADILDPDGHAHHIGRGTGLDLLPLRSAGGAWSRRSG
jgi:uncharacterized protein